MRVLEDKLLDKENLQQISTMALFIQLNSYTPSQENTQQINFLTPLKLESILTNLKKSLTLGGTQIFCLQEETAYNGLKLAFTVEVDKNSELYFQFWLAKSLRIKSLIVLGHRASYLRIRSIEVRKNMTMIASFINSANKKSQIFLIINSQTGKLQFSPSFYLGRNLSKQNILLDLKSLITQCLIFAKHFNSLILYKANLISKHNFFQNCSEKMRSWFFKSNGQFATLHKIEQFLSLSNSKISYSLKQTKKSKVNKDHQYINIQKIRDKFYNRSYTHDIVLYTQNSFYSKTKKSKFQSQDYNSLMVDYKTQQCIKYDNNYVFSTIYLYQEQIHSKKKEICIAQTQKIKALLINAKLNYGLTLPCNDIKHSMDQLSVQQTFTQNQLMPATSKMIEKYLVVKIPNPKLLPQFQYKVSEVITYQKMILRNLRGAECRYLPKYYQTQQKNVKYRDSLLIDYISGPTLSSILANNIKHKTIAWKLNLLMHLSNSIRFLQNYDIAHLDISANNIIIPENNIPKIIDFGEAYHQQTTQSFLRLRKIKKNSHKPGKTFPFAAPETTVYDWNFSSKQDIFSLGMIGFYLILGHFPNTCSEKNIPKWYINGNFNESVLFSPEGVEWIAQHELMLSCIQLILSCIHPNQKRRPYPSWAHIIFALMFQLVDPNS